MPGERDRGALSADIPDDAVAEALAAVERHARPEAPLPGPPPVGAGEGEARGLEAELATALEEARRLEERLREEHDARVRAAADLDNLRKRAARERDELLLYGVERLVKELLPALDALEGAAASASADDPLGQGVALTRRMLEEALARFGVKPFSSRGEPFDPRRHEALMTLATAEHPPHQVVDEQHRGWMLHDKLLRPAAVVVAAAPAATPGDGAPPDERT